jgi:hypothetical protein
MRRGCGECKSQNLLALKTNSKASGWEGRGGRDAAVAADGDEAGLVGEERQAADGAHLCAGLKTKPQADFEYGSRLSFPATN